MAKHVLPNMSQVLYFREGGPRNDWEPGPTPGSYEPGSIGLTSSILGPLMWFPSCVWEPLWGQGSNLEACHMQGMH